jgi:glyoxylase-like metal-dependent hydrolase (beta-lactamase superfamily II)
MRTWISRILTALVIVFAAAYYWLLIESPAPRPFALPIAEIRKLAQSLPGEHPREIRVEHVADFRAPSAVMITGGGWSQQTMWAVSYLLGYPDHTAIIDTAMTVEHGKGMGAVSTFYGEAFQRMTEAMSRASLIVITHEHPDHIGGLTVNPGLLKTSARLTEEQLREPDRALPAKFPEGALSGYAALKYEHPLAIAPGIVLIHSPGHSPGSQMIFVQLDTGAEVLFLGDVAWVRRNVETRKGRPRLVGYLLQEDRAAVLGQLAALQAVLQSEPGITLIPGHDAGVIRELIANGRLKAGF